jgi:hypothetical protein
VEEWKRGRVDEWKEWKERKSGRVKEWKSGREEQDD